MQCNFLFFFLMAAKAALQDGISFVICRTTSFSVGEL